MAEKSFEINSYEYDGKEQPVIDFKDGKRLTLPQIEQMFGEYGTATEPLLGRSTGKRILKFLKENNPTKKEFIKHFTSIELNKGGTAMKNQMKMAFMQEGGLQDEGGTVDKKSGNDVPSGSLKKEVRDDVPAMLSEGEFVFPADVVRYIGLNKLMQMRQQAKMGLQMMEKMGQMGNSEEAEIPDDLPFGVTDIVVMGSDDDDDDEKEMAQGGVIYAQEGTDVPSSRSIPNWVNPPSGDGPVTMAQVKLTNPVTGETFTANTGGYSVKSVDEIKRMMGEENTDVSAQGPTNQQAGAIGNVVGQLAGFGGGTGTQGNSGFMPHMYFYNTDTKQYRILPAGMLGRMSGDTEITQEEYKKAIGDGLANERIQEANKVYENMPQPKPEKDYTRSKEPVAQRKNRIDEGYYIDRPLPPQQQQTDFERMMGYGAGQGANPYMARRVPYTKEDGTIVNVLEDYAGRPMESIEGLTRVDPYQAGPVIGGDTPAGGGVDPVVPPMPIDPTDDTAARRERERKDDRKKAREAERKGEMEKMYNREAKKLGITPKEYKEKLFGTAAYDYKDAMSFKDRLALGKEDLENKADQLKNVISGAKDELKEIVKVDKTEEEKKRLREKRKDKKRRKDAREGKGAFAKREQKTGKDGRNIGGRAKGGLMKKDYP